MGVTAPTNVWKEADAPEFFSSNSCPPSLKVLLEGPPDERDLSRTERACVDLIALTPQTLPAITACLAAQDAYTAYCGPSCGGVCAFLSETNDQLSGNPTSPVILPPTPASPVPVIAWAQMALPAILI